MKYQLARSESKGSASKLDGPMVTFHHMLLIHLQLLIINRRNRTGECLRGYTCMYIHSSTCYTHRGRCSYLCLSLTNTHIYTHRFPPPPPPYTHTYTLTIYTHISRGHANTNDCVITHTRSIKENPQHAGAVPHIHGSW